MRTSRRSAVLVTGLAATLALSACSTGGTDDPSASESSSEPVTQDITITVAHEQEFNAYNNGTGTDNAIKNTVVLNQVLTGFWEYGEDGTVVPTEEFGTYEKTSDDPLTVDVQDQPGRRVVRRRADRLRRHHADVGLDSGSYDVYEATPRPSCSTPPARPAST